VLVDLLRGLGHGCDDVPQIGGLDVERRGEMLGQSRVADRRGPHVDAAATLTEVERRADHGQLHGHGSKANVRPVGTNGEGAVRVLLADDDAAFLQSLQPLIEHQPELTVVGAAENGLHAIELADELLPDAVVIDLHMPLLDGVSAVARLRKDHPHLCLIALTGDPDTQLHDAVREAGADAVLQKGELVDTLVERLAAVKAATQPG
jgi:CheY-like chemotaxis protein